MKNLSVANGTYEKDGQQKTRWVNVGKIMVKDGKEFMLIDPLVNFAAFPREAGKDMVMVGIFEEQNNNNQNQGNYNNQQNNQQSQQNYNQPNQQQYSYPQQNYNNPHQQ